MSIKNIKKASGYLFAIFVVGWIAAGWVFPPLFQQLYESPMGESIGLDRYPIERWLKQWGTIWLRVAIVSALVATALYAIRNRNFRRWYDRVSPVRGDALEKTATRSRVPFYVLGGFILFGQVVDILIAREHWPFSHFPMYTGIQKEEYQRNRPEGILPDGSEISLVDYFVPLSPGKVSNVIVSYGSHDPDKHNQRCAEEYYKWYVRSRELGRHDGPEILGVRVYELQWTINENADNIDSPNKVLLGEHMGSNNNE